MKRDMDLARDILLLLEENPEAIGPAAVGVSSDRHSAEEVSYHVMLLHEAGLIEAVDQTDSEGLDWEPIRLTWEGHEFLDASREESRWQKAKKVVKEKTGGLAFETLKMLLREWGKEALANAHLPL